MGLYIIGGWLKGRRFYSNVCLFLRITSLFGLVNEFQVAFQVTNAWGTRVPLQFRVKGRIKYVLGVVFFNGVQVSISTRYRRVLSTFYNGSSNGFIGFHPIMVRTNRIRGQLRVMILLGLFNGFGHTIAIWTTTHAGHRTSGVQLRFTRRVGYHVGVFRFAILFQEGCLGEWTFFVVAYIEGFRFGAIFHSGLLWLL